MIIEGIALEPTEDVQGTDWPEDALREASESLGGVPVVEEFGDDPNTIGEVIESEYRDGDGVWYRAEIDDSVVLDGMTIAPAVTFGAPVMDDEQDRMMVKGLEFESMAPVVEATEAVGEHDVVDTVDVEEDETDE